MEFEFDINKSIGNKFKHGIDFHEAQLIWQDRNALEIPLMTQDGEERYMVLGCIGFKVWAAIITYRNYSIRIISVRRARKKEIELYENI